VTPLRKRKVSNRSPEPEIKDQENDEADNSANKRSRNEDLSLAAFQSPLYVPNQLLNSYVPEPNDQSTFLLQSPSSLDNNLPEGARPQSPIYQHSPITNMEQVDPHFVPTFEQSTPDRPLQVEVDATILIS
jgi:hypothetical protein